MDVGSFIGENWRNWKKWWILHLFLFVLEIDRNCWKWGIMLCFKAPIGKTNDHISFYQENHPWNMFPMLNHRRIPKFNWGLCWDIFEDRTDWDWCFFFLLLVSMPYLLQPWSFFHQSIELKVIVPLWVKSMRDGGQLDIDIDRSDNFMLSFWIFLGTPQHITIAIYTITLTVWHCHVLPVFQNCCFYCIIVLPNVS